MLAANAGWYELAAIRSHLAGVVGRLSIEIESAEPMPVTEHREFAFIRDSKLRSILERDYVEIQKAFVSECWKSVIILAGGALETILLDLVRRDEAKAKASRKAPTEPNVTRWDLAQLIDVSVDLKLVNPYVATVSDATRAYRNLVHPGAEVRTGLTFGAEEAKIAVTVLQVVHRDLSR